MSKVTGPLLSFNARGQLGQTVTFRNWRGIKVAAQYAIPGNPNTLAQQETRSIFRTLNGIWRFMPEAARAPWNAFAAGRQFTGFNHFIGLNTGRLRKPDGQMDMANFLASCGALGGPGPVAVTPTPAADSISFALTLPAIPTGWTLEASAVLAIEQQDPSDPFSGPAYFASDDVSPESLVLTDLEGTTEYVYGVYLVWERDDGKAAYSISTQGTSTTS